MKTRILILLFILSGLWVAAQEEAEKVKVGETVPNFTVEMFDGTKIDIESLRGKVVLLNFWATWCPPCRAEFARVPKEIIEHFTGKDFVFLPISREESRETVKKFRESTGYDFPMGLDPKREIFPLFATQSIPRNYLIDKNGKITHIEIGYGDEQFKELIRNIEQELEK